MPKVSVLTAVYNGEAYLAEAIESILSQTLTDFEYLIVDDGSTDRTREILLSYSDPRIRLIVNDQNLGLARSLNRGLTAASGELIARQDADDLSEPARLARQVAFLEAHPEVALVGSGYTEIDAQGVQVATRGLPTNHDQIVWSLQFSCPFVHSAAMFRRSVVPALVGGYDETLSYSMDYELWRRIASRARVANLAGFLVRLRTNPESMTATYGDRAREGVRMRMANLGELLGWATEDPKANLARFDTLCGLASGVVDGQAPADLERSASELAHLERHFCRTQRLSWRHRLIFRERLRRLVASSLMKAVISNRHAYTRRQALRLTALACRWHAPAAVGRFGASVMTSRQPPAPDGHGLA